MVAFPMLTAPIGGISQPVTPTIGTVTVSGTTATFTVTNDNASLGQTYQITSTVGTGSSTGANCTVTGMTAATNAVITITAVSRKGGLTAQTTRTVTRTGYTYTTVCQCCGWTGPDEFGWWYCNCYNNCAPVKNATPNGWIDSGIDWYYVT